MRKRTLAVAAAAAGVVVYGVYGFTTSARRARPFAEERPVLSSAELDAYCEDAIGRPRIERVGEHVWVAIGYDLANVILVRNGGHGLLIDTAMSPARAKTIRADLLAASPGPIEHIILTHSHIDHIGGLSAWVDGEAQPPDVWATDAFIPHFFKQYGSFRQAELVRGARQFGHGVAAHASPCAGIGPHADIEAALESGVRLPTRTFSREATLKLGDWEVHLREAHGETHDQLFVHIPAIKALFPGDNWYRTFPNLYTIRGTSPRPIDAWIESLDAMRALEATSLVPSHTRPVKGAREVQHALTVYRDGIQWVRDQTTRRSNAGHSVDAIAASAGLPPELRNEPSLREFYGQIDWSARAIYTSSLGWFDGTPGALYPLPPDELAARTISAMGGAHAVVAEAKDALSREDNRWALHLLELLDRAENANEEMKELRVRALEGVATSVSNTNGRLYLLEYANELRETTRSFAQPRVNEELVESIPLSIIFGVMQTKLVPELAADVHESLRFVFSNPEGQGPTEIFVTVRNRIAEVAYDQALPGTPEPVATLRCSSDAWRALALGLKKPRELVLNGELRIDGNPLHAIRFLDRFERSF